MELCFETFKPTYILQELSLTTLRHPMRYTTHCLLCKKKTHASIVIKLSNIKCIVPTGLAGKARQALLNVLRTVLHK